MTVAGLSRLLLALLAASLLALLPATQPGGDLQLVSAHNLDQRMVYIFFDPDTKALLDARIPTLTPPQPLLQVGDEIGLIIKVIPTDGTDTGVGGYIDFYVPNGVTVLDAAYVLPDNAGGFDTINMKGQALMPAVGAGGGPTVSLVGITRGPNILGVTSPVVSPANVNLGTTVGVYGDIGIFYSTDPETAYDTWVTLEGGGTMTSNSGDTFSPYNAWDAEQMAAYGINGTTNANYPTKPLIDSNGRGNAPWGWANVVAGPQSGYAWEFDLDDYAACDPIPYVPSTACIDAATDELGPWNRIQYPGSQISDDPPGSNPLVQPYTSGTDASTVGFDLSPASPLPSTVSQTDTTSPKALRWAVGQLTNGRPEYALVKFRIDDLAAVVDETGCPLFHADTFGGDAGGDSNGKDHEWRYYDPTKITWNGCLAVGKPASRQAVKVGDTFQYTISAYNTSPTQDLSSVVVRDTLPSGVQFISAVPAQTSGPNPLVWNVGTLLRGQKFQAVVTVKATSSGALENTVQVTGVTTGGDPVTSTSTETTLAGNYPILKQSKTVSPPAVPPGGSVQYTVTIDNIGSGPTITPVRIEEHLPTGFSYVSLDSVTVNGTNALGSTTVNASLPNDPVFTVGQPINAGKSLVLTFTATTDPSLSPGSGYCNVFSSFTNVPLTTGSEACVSIGGAAIGDTIYRDWDGSGTQDPTTEEGIAGVTVNLYAGSCPPTGGVIRTDTTDANGNYLLNGLTAGAYCVETIPPADHSVTGDPEGALDGYATVTLVDDEENFDIDFGLQPGGALTIGDLVFEDMGNDGSYDPGAGDVGIPNVSVSLYEDTNGNGIVDAEDALLATTSTDGSGLYSFTGLAPGFDYIADVDELDPDIATHFGGAPTLLTTDDPHAVPNLAADYTAADFGFYEIVPGSIGDEVCIDSDADGSCAGEALLPNVTVRLYRDGNGNGVLDMGEPLLATTSTDINGVYTFGNLPPGDYIVDVEQGDPDVPSGYFPSADLIAVSLGFAEDRSDVDFPFVRILDKSVDKTQADPGETLTYSIVARYPGSRLLSNVIVTDPIPSGTTYVADSDDPEAIVTPADDATATQIQWDLGTNTADVPAETQSGYLCRDRILLTSVADTYIEEDDQAADNSTAQDLFSRAEATKVKRPLYRFDLSSIPAGATVVSADLNLFVQTTRDEQESDVKRVTTSWTEAANWNSPWTSPGGDFASTVYASFDPSTGGYQAQDVTSLLQGWVDGSFANEGLVLDPRFISGGHGDAKYRSREANADEQPFIEAVYEYVDPVGCLQTVQVPSVADTYIEEDDQAADNSTSQDLFSRAEATKVKRPLYRFDLSSIPAGATVVSADLNLFVQTTRDEQESDVKRVTTSWTEAANWNSPWTSSGGDFASTVYASFDPSTGGYQAQDVTTLVAGWVDGSFANEGLVLDPRFISGGHGDAKYRSREANADEQPFIEITYRSPVVSTRLVPTQDTYIEEDDQAADNSGDTALLMRVEPTKVNRALIQFDTSVIPSGATVSAAELGVFVNGTRDEQDEQVKRLTTAWTDTANWTAPWTNPGGDFASTVYGTIDPSTSGYQTTSITSLVSGWVDGSFSNYGLVLDPVFTAGGYGDAQIRSMEQVDEEPYVDVTYTAPGAGTGTRSVLTAGPTLVADGDVIQVTLALTATETVSAVSATDPIIVNGINGAAATCGSPSPATQDVIVDSVALYSYSCTVDASGVTALPASLTFEAGGTSTSIDFGAATSNSVLLAPPLTYQVTIDGPPAPVDPVVNTATIEDDGVIPATSDPAVTAIQASIGDRVWADLDGDGVQDAGEPGLAGVEVCATPVGGGTPVCATTDASGDYRIYGLDDTLDYQVKWTPGTVPAGYVATTPMMLTVTAVQLQAASGFYSNADFGLRPPGDASIGDTVWIDANEDGVVDAGETLLAGVTVELYDSTGTNLLATTTTDANGTYSFDGLYAGDYVVQVDETSAVTTPYGIVTTIAAAMELVSGSVSNPVSVNLPADDSVVDTVDFGYNWAGSIGDTTYYDDNANGVQDGLEAVAPNVVVTLNYDTNGNGEIDSGEPLIGILITDASGNYTFDNLPPGNYVVKGEEQTVESPTNPGTFGTMVPTTGEEIAVSLAPSQDYVDADVGFIEAALVEGHVYHDVSNNGVLDPGEPGLEPVEVTLTGTDIGGNPVSLTTTTDADGEYHFIVPPGEYTITYSQADVLLIDPGLTDVTTVSSYTIFPNAGQEIGGLDFGVDHTGTIGDTVYNDANGDGAQQLGEPGLAGVTVQLYDSTGTTLLAQVATDADGNYLFAGLEDGTYLVRIDEGTIPLADPPGFVQTQDPDEGGACSTCDAEGTATVTAGGSDLSLDFGYQPTAVLRTIGGTVYEDLNDNGDDDDGPGNGFAGVTVSVVCDSGSFATVTDIDGNWSISGIPDGSVCTVLDADEADLPSTALVATETPGMPITVDADIVDLDFGYFEDLGSISGTVCVGDGDGQCSAETALPNVDVTLSWAGPDGILGTGDDIVTVVQTDGSGDYTFSGLQPGLYQIAETNPAGYDSLADSDGGNPDNISTNLAIGENKIDQDFEDTPIGMPAIEIQKTVYRGHDGGASCAGGELVTDVSGAAVTYCFAVTNTGDTYLDAIAIDDVDLSVDETAMTLLGSPSFPLAPSATAVWYYQTAIAGDLVNTADVSANPTDDQGNDMPGLTDPTDSDTAEVDQVAPAIEVQKTVYEGHDGGASCAGGELVSDYLGTQVTYCFAVTNTGDTYLDAVAIDDLDLGIDETDLTLLGSPSFPLAPGASASWYYETTIAGNLVNTADASANPTNDQGGDLVGLADVTDSDTAEVVGIVPGTPDIRITKTADPVTIYSGATVLYTFVVDNIGDTALSGIAPSDDHCSPLAYQSGDTDLDGLLDIGEAWTYTCSTAVGVDTTNTAQVTGTPSDEQGDPIPLLSPISDMDTASVNVIDPAIALEKVAVPTQTTPGGSVVYSFLVSNPGDDPLANVSLTDDTCSPISGLLAGDANSNGLLDPGEIWSYDCSATVVDDTLNTADVTAEDSLGGPVTDTDTAFVDVVVTGLDIEKTADATVVYAGTLVTYGYTAVNTGQDPLSNVVVTDDTCAPVSFDGGDTNANGELDPGETWVYSCSQVLNADTTNVATGTAEDPLGNPVAPDDAVLTVDVINPAIAVQKSVSPAVIEAGQAVVYSYLVTNAGDDPLANVSLSDDTCSPVSGPQPGNDANSNGLLDPSETWAYACGASPGVDTTNTVTATGDDSLGNPVEDTDTAFVDVVAPVIELVKTASESIVYPGTVVTYDLLVSNGGDVALADVVVSDDTCSPVTGPDPAGDLDSDGLLDPGETWAYACSAELDEDTTNLATATGNPVDDNGNDLPAVGDVSDQDTAAVNVINPAIDLVKTADPPLVTPGTTVVWTFAATNIGDDPLTSVVVTDDTCTPVTGPDPAGDLNSNGLLDPGETWEYSCSAIVNDDTVNVASVDSDDSLGNPVTDEATALVDAQDVDLEIVKSVDASVIYPGGTVIYSYAVTNVGSDQAQNIVVTDDHCAPVSYVSGDNGNGKLEPSGNETWVFTCQATLSEDTVNVATVTGEDILGSPVEPDMAMASVDVINPAIAVAKTADPVVVLAGGTVTYGYVVTNPGDDPLANVTLSDDTCSPVSGPDPAGDLNSNGLLDPGEVWSYDCSTTVAADTTNTVTATGDDSLGSPVQDTDTAFVDVVAPAIQVVKTVTTGGVCPGVDALAVESGTGVTYCYAVTNTGDTYLSDIVVGDDLLGAVCTIPGPLAPGATQTCIATAVVSADVTNTGTASGNPTDGQGNDLPGLSDPSDDDTAFVDVVAPAVTVQKTVYQGHDGGASCAGGERVTEVLGGAVTYCFELTNTGDTYLDDFGLLDVDLGVTLAQLTPVAGPSFPLAPAATAVWYYETTVSGDLVNRAEASANPTDDQGNDLPGLTSPTDSDTAEVDRVAPAIRIEKTVYAGHDAGLGCPGGELVSDYTGTAVTYCFAVSNTGDTYLDIVAIDDLDLGVDETGLTLLGSPSFPLAPGASASWYYETAIAGDLVNTADVSANPTDDQGGDLPGLADPTGSDTAEVTDLGSPTSCLGDQVFFDLDNDGLYEPGSGEFGIDGLLINLYLDTDASGALSVGDTFVAETISAQGGRFEFCDLPDGEYIVQVDPSNFAPGGTLAFAQTSTGNDVLGQAPDPDDDVDGDDNGSPDVEGGVSTAAITLVNGAEPTSEDGDPTTNLTVDLGFAQQEEPTGVRLSGFSVERIDDATVEVRWSTASEVGVLGFRVQRASAPEGPYAPIDEDLVPASDASEGANYALRDELGESGTYYYRIEVVNDDSSSQFYGTVEVVIPPRSGWRLYLPALWQLDLGR